MYLEREVIKYASILDSGSSLLQHGLWTLTHLMYTVQHKLTLRVADNLNVRTLTPLPLAGLCHACLQSHWLKGGEWVSFFTSTSNSNRYKDLVAVVA